MKSRVNRALDAIERAGNKLPSPIALFVILAACVLLASFVAAKLGITVEHPRDGSTIRAVNLLDRSGVRRLFTDAVKNFLGFAPLGTVLAAMIGIGVAEASGLIAVALRAFVMSVPRGWLTAAVVFAGVNANLAADAGLVVLPPVAGMLFAAVGRHPLAGIAAAFAGVAGAFSANLVPTPLDVVLAGISQEALNASRLVDNYEVQVLGNYFFRFVSTPLLTIVGTLVTDKIVEPHLGKWTGQAEPLRPLESVEKRGLIAAAIALVFTSIVCAMLTLPAGAPLRDDAPSLLGQLKPFFDSLVIWVLLFFLLPGIAYGVAVGKIKSDHDIAKMTGDTLGTMGSYIALAFVAAQFINYFGWSNLGAIIAITGAGFLRSLELGGPVLVLAFVGLTSVLNLFVTSATAMWAILAPVFVPMFALLGFTPEGTMAIYRVGDSSTNIITPLFPYLPIILGFARRFDPKAGNGTLLSLMVPYAICFLIFWTILLLIFYVFDLPIGPGVHILLNRP